MTPQYHYVAFVAVGYVIRDASVVDGCTCTYLDIFVTVLCMCISCPRIVLANKILVALFCVMVAMASSI